MFNQLTHEQTLEMSDLNKLVENSTTSVDLKWDTLTLRNFKIVR